jgi:hypothetical protein
MSRNKFLESLNLHGNLYAHIVAKSLPSLPKSERWFRLAVQALEVNARNDGGIWRKWLTEHRLNLADVVAAMRSWYRHNQTNYEALLNHPREPVAEREAAWQLVSGEGALPNLWPDSFVEEEWGFDERGIIHIPEKWADTLAVLEHLKQAEAEIEAAKEDQRAFAAELIKLGCAMLADLEKPAEEEGA